MKEYIRTNTILIHQHCLEVRSKTQSDTCDPPKFWILVLDEPLKLQIEFWGHLRTWPIYLMVMFWRWWPFPGPVLHKFWGEHPEYFPSYTSLLQEQSRIWHLGMCAHLPGTPVHAETTPHLSWWMKTREASVYSLIITKISIVALTKSWHSQVWTDSCNISRSPFLFINCDNISFHLFHLPPAKAY